MLWSYSCNLYVLHFYSKFWKANDENQTSDYNLTYDGKTCYECIDNNAKLTNCSECKAGFQKNENGLHN